MLKGTTVILHVKTKTGEDGFGRETYEDSTVEVENVLIGQPSEADVISANQMGKTISYTIGIPKGDTHVWEDTEVEFWGRKWRTVGAPVRGIDGLVPLSWDQNVQVEVYE